MLTISIFVWNEKAPDHPELSSVAMRFATEVAATRRGWVQAITFPSAAQPASRRYWGSSGEHLELDMKPKRDNLRVVFLQPV